MKLRGIISSLALFTTLAAAAQQGPVSRYDRFEYDLQWNSFSNPAAVAFTPKIVLSTADVVGSNSLGALCQESESNMMLGGDLSTCTHARLGEKTAFKGGLMYNIDYGRNMGGPVLMDPSYNSVNFYEYTDTTRGPRMKELYGADFAVAYSIVPAWSIGANLSYIAGDQSKRKDPRYRSSWMDMNIAAGALFAPSQGFTVGLNGIFRKTVEKVAGGVYGYQDASYYTFIDFGAGIGRLESIEGQYNYIGSSAPGRPMVNFFYGGALQLHFGDRVRVDNEVKALYRKGWHGDNTSASPRFVDHNGIEVYDAFQIDIPGVSTRHRINADFAYKTLNTFENTYTYTTSSLGVTTVQYKDSKQCLLRSDILTDVRYLGQFVREGEVYLWNLGATASFDMRNVEGRIMPFYSRQNRMAAALALQGTRNVVIRGSVLSVGLDLGASLGFGTALDKGQYSAGTSSTVRYLDIYVLPQFEYETAPRGSFGINLAWDKPVSERFSFSLSLKDSAQVLFSAPQYLRGRFRNVLSVGVGFNF